VPVANINDTVLSGPDAINELADYIARMILGSWPSGVNTTKPIATTNNINANGIVTGNIIRGEGSGWFGGNVDIEGHTTSANGITAAYVRGNGDLYVGLESDPASFSVRDRCNRLEQRIAALEAK
jgi:hypothetical protein